MTTRTSRFTDQEDKIIEQYIVNHVVKGSTTIPKSVWKNINLILPSRTEISIKNRFYRFVNANIQWIPSTVKTPTKAIGPSSQSQSQLSTPNFHRIFNSPTSTTLISQLDSQSSVSSGPSQDSQDSTTVPSYNTMLNTILFEDMDDEPVGNELAGNPVDITIFQTNLITQPLGPSQTNDEYDEPMSFADEWTDESDDELEESDILTTTDDESLNDEEIEWEVDRDIPLDLITEDQYLLMRQKVAWISYITEVKEASILKLLHLFGGNLTNVYRFATHNYNYEGNFPWSLSDDRAIHSGNAHRLYTRTQEEIDKRYQWLTSDVCSKLSMEFK